MVEHQRKMFFPFSEKIGCAQIRKARNIFSFWCPLRLCEAVVGRLSERTLQFRFTTRFARGVLKLNCTLGEIPDKTNISKKLNPQSFIYMALCFPSLCYNKNTMETLIWLVLGLGFFLILFGLRIIDQYERGVVLTLGKYSSTRTPGLTWIFIGIQKMTKVDLRITTTDIPQQEVITKDNVPVGINAVVYFQVQSAEKAILNIKDYTLAVSQYAQAALRDVIGGIELDPLLSEREQISEEIQKIVVQATESWGISVTDIKIQDIELPADMKRVMAKQAESERERRAIVIRAQGEFEASKRLAEAAGVLTSTPGGISMRTLQTIEKINPDPSKTVIFSLPVEFFEGIKSLSSYLDKK